MMAKNVEVVVIGTGWAGLVAAKTYLQINPSISLTILTDDTSVGGVWSKARLYPGLIANSPNGLYEFSDLSMITPVHPAYELITGDRVADYLHEYADKFNLLTKIRFNSKVIKVDRRSEPSGWSITLESGEKMDCDKLIVSTGQCSEPKWPSIPKEQSFRGPVIHSKTLGADHKTIVASGAKNIVVVGGCKSAVETATLFLDSDPDIKVHWVIRPSAQGVPIVVVDPLVKPNFVAVAQTRLFSVFSPTIFNVTGFWYRFLHSHQNWVGSKLFDLWWSLTSKIVKAGPEYHKSENAKKIEPEGNSLFWDASFISLLYKDSRFLKWLHEGKRITVYRETPSHLADGYMSFQSGQQIKADAVIYCTGWNNSMDFFSNSDAIDLGIPFPRPFDNEPIWEKLMTGADIEVKTMLPFLKNEGRAPCEPLTHTQFRLYRQVMAPKLLARGDRTVAFVGVAQTGQTAQCFELLSLWAAAWMEGLLPGELPLEEAMMRDVTRVNACMARRYGARGAANPEIVLEAQWFFDVLMRDLGLNFQRKCTGKGWFEGFKEWLIPYTALDYRGVVDEFLALHGPERRNSMNNDFRAVRS